MRSVPVAVASTIVTLALPLVAGERAARYQDVVDPDQPSFECLARAAVAELRERHDHPAPSLWCRRLARSS